MKVKATTQFVHPFLGGKIEKDRVFDVPDNSDNQTLLKVGYWELVTDEIKDANEIESSLKFESELKQAIQNVTEAIEEKEVKKELKTKEAKVKRKTK